MVKTISGGVVLLALGLGLGGCGESGDLRGNDKVEYRLAPIVRTDIVRTVEATGTVTPRNTPKGIPVGAQVNGKIIKLFVDYNSTVTNGQVVALIDPLVYSAAYSNAVGQLHGAEARVGQCEAELKLAEKTLRRKRELFARQLCSEAELDSADSGAEVAVAALASARASVEQCSAAMLQARANLDYCTLRSPVDGVVIARKVEEGETVVSSMNAVPVLTIAEDLKTVWVDATIPEADVGGVKVGQTVTFTADAYRRKFTGRVRQIRLDATSTNNVVTYPVIIEAENPGELLFPGMTVTLSIETARADNALAVSSSAFRFRPKAEDCLGGEPPAGRKVWLADAAGKLTAVAVETGVSDEAFTQLLNAEALEDRQAVVGYQRAATKGAEAEASNPFLPKMPKHGTKGTAPSAAKPHP